MRMTPTRWNSNERVVSRGTTFGVVTVEARYTHALPSGEPGWVWEERWSGRYAPVQVWTTTSEPTEADFEQALADAYSAEDTRRRWSEREGIL